jgi:hypothetical protein
MLEVQIFVCSLPSFKYLLNLTKLEQKQPTQNFYVVFDFINWYQVTFPGQEAGCPCSLKNHSSRQEGLGQGFLWTQIKALMVK